MPSRRQPLERPVIAPPLEREIAVERFPEPLTVPSELPPDSLERNVAMTKTAAVNGHGELLRRRAAAVTSQTNQPPSVKPPFGPRRYFVVTLSIVWAAGVLLGLSRLAYGLAVIFRLRREAIELEGPSRELLFACSAALRLKRSVRLAGHPVVSSPLAVGLIRPLILVPEDWRDLSLVAQRAGLTHELAHLANYDDWTALLRALLRVVFFFHPLVRWLCWRIGFESELICDDAALDTGIAERDYARVLLSYAQRPTSFRYRRIARAPCSLPLGSGSTIKRRLSRLLDARRPWALGPFTFRRRLLLSAVCFALGGALSGITLKAAPDEVKRTADAALPAKAESGGDDKGASRPTAPTKKDLPDASEKAVKKRSRFASPGPSGIYSTEGMPVTITGVAKDEDGRPLPGATVFVSMQNKFSNGGQDAIRARATTDAAGKFAVKNVMLSVQTSPPKPDVIEAKFQVFGVSDGHGFAWHGVRAYRPRPRPAADSEPDMDRAYYQGETIVNDLVFGPTVRFAGQVKDDLGHPIAGAKVRFGVIDHDRMPGSAMWWFQLLGPDGRAVDADSRFSSIRYVPESWLTTKTDAEGRFEFANVRRDADFLAGVVATPELGRQTKSVSTDKATISGDDGKTVAWNPVFDAPRNLRVHVLDPTGKQPREAVVLHAYGRNIRFAGNEARLDSAGHALLRLPPGRYQLVAEPSFGSPYLRTEQEIDVAKEPIEQDVRVSLRPGAVVILKAALDDGTPVAGVRFSYETDTSRDRSELRSQTVFVDHPQTGANGVLRAVVEPGRRRFFVLAAPDGFEAAESESRLIDIAAGQEANVQIKLRKKASANVADAPADADDPMRHLQLLWRRQNELQFRGTVMYQMTNWATHEYVITRDDLRRAITAFDVNSGIDIATWINQRVPDLTVRLAGPYKMVMDGQRFRRESTDPSDSPSRTDIEAFNGAEIVRTIMANAQVFVEDQRISSYHIDGVNDLRRWPHISRPMDLTLVSREGGNSVFEKRSDDGLWRMVVDDATGFVYESSVYRESGRRGSDTFWFDPIQLPGGMVWPRVRIELTYQDGEFTRIKIYSILSIDPQPDLPADAFVVSLPPGTLVLASDFGEDAAKHERNQPGSPKQQVATGPITDAVQFAYSLSPKSRSLWPVLKIGQDAPALNAVAWLTKDGAIAPPDLKGKVVLIDFWGRNCGPCVGELPDLVKLAKAYTNTDLRIVGWHDSSGDVPGVAQFAAERGLPYLLAIDHEADEPGWFGALFKSFGVRGIPHAAILDREGKLVFLGHLTEAISRLENTLGEAR
ncbi:MAG TPA: M56 family metallopeptidase [Pirellulales bacterium]